MSAGSSAVPGEETPGAEAKQKRQKGPEGQEDGGC